ncbi:MULTISPECIES: DUF2076 domain-containing protein [Rhizobium/Agrobacterium group]|uniref:DUF2076 domain-containing protein n=1 Tax=Rhizobium/Agrobacterium group TaxID=227290 RepID=UPI0008DC16B4|nr:MULTISPECIES: DUF2076 domain-containing protein [Rhizobium/Agrobacterium group]MCF1433540.1 DUF2076 domain-containing protein [Allorhizobium ampelinum]MUO90773.1 DUF2076 family protein [Agrobacterium vitis]MVA40568.1 DUF2076 family protein [Agrobacterium vitis]NSX96845.1 DUF2076 domain-containing protein [Agrobacterium vitis]NSZ27984.1 DUF2076 domain-containing protein [Agrobacterium vitis]
MSPEERQLLTQLFDRVRQASSTPRDREAESLIEGELRSQPYATYYLAQAVIIQEKGLEAATAKIRDLEDQIAHLQDELSRGPAQPPAQQQSGGFLGGISSIFGGGSPAPAPSRNAGPWGAAPAQNRGYDDYSRSAPPQSGPWGGVPSGGQWQQPGQQPAAAPAGGGFLRGALTTAAGVAGGVLVADAVRDIFSSHGGGFGNMLGAGGMGGLGGMAQAPVEETIINNNTYNITENGRDDTPAQNDDSGVQQASLDTDNDSYDNSSFDDSDFGGDDSMNA